MHRIRQKIELYCLLALLFAASTDAAVLPDHINGPLSGIYGLPDSTEGSDLLSKGQQAWSLSLNTASHNIDKMAGAEILRFDGETTRLGIKYRYGISEQLEVAVEAPYVWHESGSLDSLIDNWHDFFGLPEGPRAFRERDQLEFFYDDGLAPPLNLTRNASGIGDVSLLAGWRISKNEIYSSALRLRVKLPTGDGRQLLGSGGTDISLGLAGDTNRLWGTNRLSGFYRTNVTYLGKPEFLARRYNKFVLQGSTGIGFLMTPKIDLRVQVLVRSAIYDSEIDSLGDVGVALTFGGDFEFSEKFGMSLAVGEDIKPDSVPDVSFQLAFHYRNN